MFGCRLLAVALFLAAYAQAQLTITNPSPSSWWVAGTENTLAWSCNTSPYSAYTVVLSNTDSTILTAPLALIANVPNYDCSFTVNQQQSSLAASPSWTISFSNILNQSDVYASTQFTVKPAGSTYPSSSSSSSGTATGSGSPSSSTSSSKTGAAVANYIPFGMSMAAAIVLGLVVA